MPVSKQFVDHTLDLLSGVGPVEARAMFGGYGIYFKGGMFALLDDEALFIKVDDTTKLRFENAGCKQWVYPSPKGPMAMGYFSPPDAAMEDAEAMLPWAKLGVEASARAMAAKAAKARLKPGKVKKAPTKKNARTKKR